MKGEFRVDRIKICFTLKLFPACIFSVVLPLFSQDGLYIYIKNFCFFFFGCGISKICFLKMYRLEYIIRKYMSLSG